MPRGGGYATTAIAMRNFSSAVSLEHGCFVVHPSVATPSFCSEATYLVFLKTILSLQEQKKFFLSPSLLAALMPQNQSDGQGFWGCWNANGPGVARLFYALDLGSSFTNIQTAEPGDFLKIFWTDAIGAREHGHLVIYLGKEKKGNVTYLSCWSSNQPDGYGVRSYPLSRIHHLIFSRLSRPESIEKLILHPEKDAYLASLLSDRSTSLDEVKKRCGILSNL
jgi:hypothetical protein